MESKMNIYYDEEGDFLEITGGDISNCYFKNLGNGIFEIVEKKSGNAKGIAIFNFKAKSENLETLKLSLPFQFTISSSS